MSQSDDERKSPKSMRHKRILNEAEKDPDAPIEELADRVPSATPELVENVLDDYGDPAEDDPPNETGSTGDDGHTDSNSTTEVNDQTTTQTDPTYPAVEELTDKQLETLRAVAAHPEVPQRDIAEHLDITAPTVSTRLSDIPNFEWENRRSFVKAVLETDPTPTDISDMSHTGNELHDAIDELTDRLSAVEAAIAELEDTEQEPSKNECTVEPALIQKLVHACQASDDISEAEELELLEQLLK